MTNDDFSHEPPEDKFGWEEFTYEALSVSSDGIKNYHMDRKVWVRGGKENFYRLLNHWNRGNRYYPRVNWVYWKL